MPGMVQSASRFGEQAAFRSTPPYPRSPTLALSTFYRFKSYYVVGNEVNTVMLNRVFVAMSLDLAEKADSNLDRLEAAEFGQNLEVQNPLKTQCYKVKLF